MDRWTKDIVLDYYYLLGADDYFYFGTYDTPDFGYLEEMLEVWKEHGLDTVFPSFEDFLYPGELTTF